MKHIPGWLMAAALMVPMAAHGEGVDEMIARPVAARGGAEALKAVKTVTYKGKLRPPGFDADFAYAETIARGDRVRVNLTLQGLTIVQSYDGTRGWQIQPFGGRKDPETLAADDIKSLQEEADIEGGLVEVLGAGLHDPVAHRLLHTAAGTAAFQLHHLVVEGEHRGGDGSAVEVETCGDGVIDATGTGNGHGRGDGERA